MNFKELNKKTINESETEILSFWKENNIFEKSIENRKDKKNYVFYDGPIYANAKPGIHHVFAKTIKDAFTKYKTMQGYRVLRKIGLDTQKLEQKGYIVENCNVKASLDKEGQTSGIEKIKLKISKDPNKNENEENQEQNIADAENETSSKTNNQNESENQEDENDSKNNKITIEEKVVEEIQKIKEVKIGEEKNSTEKDNQDNQNEISKTDIKNIKDFLIEEYEVNEKCLEIN